ncbi:hypothetical protein QTP70_012514 [Hemibagrus guttatus]|uniref:HAT C-terminal dimerisation domain-containing protein n=1 Tax=Hemibagrus guttatus TaxID=175788 RepID=A0AAE0PWB4_9TELE|nr:hypothetical protein QTP70_012514 [Hemibagrus guttatus]
MVIGLRENDEVQHLVAWCADNNLLLNTSKTKKLIVDFRREKGRTHKPIHINGCGACIQLQVFGDPHLRGPVLDHQYLQSGQKGSSVPFILNTLKKNHLSSTILVNFYHGAIESILTNCITISKLLSRRVKAHSTWALSCALDRGVSGVESGSITWTWTPLQGPSGLIDDLFPVCSCSLKSDSGTDIDRSGDCAVKLAPVIFPDSEIAKKLACGRTKSASIVTGVLAPACLAIKREFSLQDLRGAAEALKMSIKLDMDQLYDEFCVLLPRIKESAATTYPVATKWTTLLKHVNAPNMTALVSLALSIPVTNAFVERVFSLMTAAWTETRNRATLDLIKSELLVKMNYSYTCQEFYRHVINEKAILEAADQTGNINSTCTESENLNIFSSATSSSDSCLFLSDTVSKPYSMAGLTTVLYTFPLILADIF